MRLVRFLYRIPFALLHTFFGLAFTLVSIAVIGDKTRPAYHRVVSWWSRTLLRVFGIRLIQVGDIVPDPVVLLANHVSWLDIAAIHATHGVGFIAKAEINNWPLVGYMARAGGSIFHQRGSHDSQAQVTTAIAERLGKGRGVAIFAEGRAGTGGKVLPFHGRLLQPAKDLSVMIQPVAIRFLTRSGKEADIAFRPGESFVGNFFRVLGGPPTRCEVHLLESIPPEGLGRREISTLARDRVVEVMKEYE